jgi:hypothetical protein
VLSARGLNNAGDRRKGMRYSAILGLLILIAIALWLCGCGSTTNFYVYDKESTSLMHVGQVQQDSAGSAAIETKDTKMSVDTRQPNWWERNIMPVFSGAVSKTQESIDYNLN